MKRLICIILALGLLLGTAGFAAAEEDEEVEFTAEELQEMEEEQREAGEEVQVVVQGEVYHEKTKEDCDLKSPAL